MLRAMVPCSLMKLCAQGKRGLQRRRQLALGQMLIVVLIWSSSFVGVKAALRYTGPLTIAAFRYFLAFLFLFPWLLRHQHLFQQLKRTHWLRFALMGIAQYTIGNGVLYIAMKTLSATTGSLALCLLPIPVFFLGVLYLKERMSWLRLLGLIATIGGSFLFFSRGLAPGEPRALFLLSAAVLCASAFPVLGREFARGNQVNTTVLTALPLGIGGGILVILASTLEGIPRMPLLGWGIIVGLAVINTLVPYLLYSHALRTLHAVEANLIVSLTPLGTSLIALGALGERLSPIQFAAMVMMMGGACLVLWRRSHCTTIRE